MIKNSHPFESIVRYCEEKSSAVPDYLNELERETHLKMLLPQMVSGPHLGQFLYMIAKLIQPKIVVEIGTFTGYAALSIWRALSEDAKIHTYEVNPETQWIFNKYVDIAGAKNQITQHMQDITEAGYDLPGPIDLSWIDADKKQNLDYFEKILDKTRQGGLIMIDNTLWSGKVLEKEVDKVTKVIQEMNDKLAVDPRVDTIMLPVRDGVTLAIKK